MILLFLIVECDVGQNLCGFIWAQGSEREVQTAIVAFENQMEEQKNENGMYISNL